MAENAYRLVLQCKIDDEDFDVEFDNIDNESITDTSDITNHPLVNGDMIADHMYRMPVNMNISGTFSLYGNRPTAYSGTYNDRLSNIESFFTKIKNEGIFCRLVKLSKADNVSSRFMARDNMVLTSITWNEKQSSVSFSFNFTEAIVARIQDVQYEEDTIDVNLPAITDAATLDFTDTLLDWTEVDRLVVYQLVEAGIITQEFLDYSTKAVTSTALEVVASAALGGGVGLVGASAVGISILVAIFGIGSIPVWGWIAAGALATIVAVGVGIYFGVKAYERAEAEIKYKVRAFELYEDDKKNQAEVERFCNYLGRIHQNLETLEEHLHVYGIASNEAQECMLYLDDNYYIFKFSKNNTNERYSLEVITADGKHPEGGLGGMMSELVGFSNISECTDSNELFRTAGKGSWVYVMNLASEKAKAENKTEKEVEELNKDLRNYAIFVSEINMSQFSDAIQELVVEAMTR